MILYIHPSTKMFFRSIVPMSLPALLNRLPQPLLGRFENEVTEGDLRKASIVLLDIHWYLSIRSAIRLSRKIKAINPQATIIAGGLSASIFFKQLLRESKIDYIVRGDAELPLKELVAAVLTHADISQIPNIASRNFHSPRWYALTSKDMDESDYINISFFPSLQKDIFKIHRTYHRHPMPAYPCLTVFRGCQTVCNGCHGAEDIQKLLFNRSMVVRSKERVRDDLISWSNDCNISFVNIYHDFLTSLPAEYSEYVLGEAYNLYVFYDLFRLPSKQNIDLLNNAFKGGIVVFPMDKRHSTSEELQDTTLLIERIKQLQEKKKFKIYLAYVKLFVRKNPAYAGALQKIHRATNCTMLRVDFWWENIPINKHGPVCSEETYQYIIRRDKRFVFYNAVLRLGAFFYTYSPGLIEFIARRTRRLFG